MRFCRSNQTVRKKPGILPQPNSWAIYKRKRPRHMPVSKKGPFPDRTKCQPNTVGDGYNGGKRRRGRDTLRSQIGDSRDANRSRGRGGPGAREGGEGERKRAWPEDACQTERKFSLEVGETDSH